MTVDIKAQLELLKELQSIDIHLREIEEELTSIPQLMENAKAGWSAADAGLTQKEGEKAEAEKERRLLEQELEDSVAHLHDRENKLYAIKTNKEYQAALKEIADGKRANKDREDAVLKLMEKVEKLSQEITQLSQTAADKEKEFRKEEQELGAKKTELEKELSVRASEVEKVRKHVEKSFIEKYNFIRTRYLDPLAAVVKGICQGCNMNIPPQMYIELLKNLKVHFCPNCHRFIYAEEGGGVTAGDIAKGADPKGSDPDSTGD